MENKPFRNGWAWFLLLSCITTGFTGNAQDRVSGTVGYDGMPLSGASVFKKGSGLGATTDDSGVYSITAAANDTLVFSYVGLESQFVAVNGRTVIDVAMRESSNAIQEVTVNAGYYKVKDRERTGSISRISAKEIELQPVPNVLAVMQGRMPGVNVTQQTGMPGGGFEIQVRGLNSLRTEANNPLYIIDGVPYASDPIGSIFTMGPMPRQVSPLNSINPSDIESIEVLKDADATAIYGSRGANGVVLITTKKGKAGKTTFNATVSGGLSWVGNFRDLLDTAQYLEMRRRAFENDGIATYPATAYDVNGTWDENRYTDWQKELLGGTAQNNTVQASVSGGSDYTQFLVGGTYSKETTVFPGDFDYQRGGAHSSLTHRSKSDRFRLEMSTGYTVQRNDMPGADLSREAVTIAPTAPALYDEEGELNWENGTFQNPLRVLRGRFTTRTHDLLANATLSYRLVDRLVLKSAFGYTDLRHRQLTATPSTMQNPSFGLGSEASTSSITNAARRSWIVEPQLSYGFSMGGTKVEALLGGTFQQQDNESITNRGVGFSSNSLIGNPAAANVYTTQENIRAQYKYQAFFGRVNFTLKDKYILNLTGRRDGSSRFGPENRYANFGAAGLAWLFGEEKLVKGDGSFISFGKLRASYGTSGSDQIGDYQYLNTYVLSGANYQGTAGMAPSRLFNPSFAWESNTKLEIAIELGLFKDRVFTTAAWYRNRSSNQLLGVPLPGTTGFTSITANLDATVENRGIELTLRTVNVKRGKFSWTTDFNFTKATNELLSFPGLEGSTYANQFVIGESVNILKLYRFTGLDPETGLYTFEDVNEDGVMTIADKVVVKDFTPEFFGGVSNQLRCGPLTLDVLFQFVKQQNFSERFGTQLPGAFSNQPVSVLNDWQQPGDDATVQLYSTGGNPAAVAAQNLFAQSDATVVDASYVRLKNIALTFDVPQKWTKGMSCKLSLQGQNVFTWTGYKGTDPEFRTAGFLPPLKVISSSLQISF